MTRSVYDYFSVAGSPNRTEWTSGWAGGLNPDRADTGALLERGPAWIGYTPNMWSANVVTARFRLPSLGAGSFGQNRTLLCVDATIGQSGGQYTRTSYLLTFNATGLELLATFWQGSSNDTWKCTIPYAATGIQAGQWETIGIEAVVTATNTARVRLYRQEPGWVLKYEESHTLVGSGDIYPGVQFPGRWWCVGGVAHGWYWQDYWKGQYWWGGGFEGDIAWVKIADGYWPPPNQPELHFDALDGLTSHPDVWMYMPDAGSNEDSSSSWRVNDPTCVPHLSHQETWTQSPVPTGAALADWGVQRRRADPAAPLSFYPYPTAQGTKEWGKFQNSYGWYPPTDIDVSLLSAVADYGHITLRWQVIWVDLSANPVVEIVLWDQVDDTAFVHPPREVYAGDRDRTGSAGPYFIGGDYASNGGSLYGWSGENGTYGLNTELTVESGPAAVTQPFGRNSGEVTFTAPGTAVIALQSTWGLIGEPSVLNHMRFDYWVGPAEPPGYYGLFYGDDAWLGMALHLKVRHVESGGPSVGFLKGA